MNKRLKEKIAWARRRMEACLAKEDTAEAAYYAAVLEGLEGIDDEN